MQTSLFLLIVEIAGTIAFAISGIRLAAAKILTGLELMSSDLSPR